MNDQRTPSATEAPWSKTGGKAGKKRRGPLIIAAVLGLLTVLGVSIYATRDKPEAPSLAGLPSSSTQGAAPVAVVSDVHAAVPAASVEMSPPASAEVANASPSANSALPALAGSAKAGERVPARAVEPAPGGPRYTYFGGRR